MGTTASFCVGDEISHANLIERKEVVVFPHTVPLHGVHSDSKKKMNKIENKQFLEEIANFKSSQQIKKKSLTTSPQSDVTPSIVICVDTASQETAGEASQEGSERHDVIRIPSTGKLHPSEALLYLVQSPYINRKYALILFSCNSCFVLIKF